jgi:hypothetical protein
VRNLARDAEASLAHPWCQEKALGSAVAAQRDGIGARPSGGRRIGRRNR